MLFKRQPVETITTNTTEVAPSINELGPIGELSERSIRRIGDLLLKRHDTKLIDYSFDASIYDVNSQALKLPGSAYKASGNPPRFGKFEDGAILSFASVPGLLTCQHTLQFPIEKKRVGEITYCKRAIESDSQIVSSDIHDVSLGEMLHEPFVAEMIGKAALLVELLHNGTIELGDGNIRAFETAFKQAWPTIIDLESV